MEGVVVTPAPEIPFSMSQNAGAPHADTSSEGDRIDWRSTRVLVTGATGFVGWRLTRALLDLGAEVVCFVRDHDPASPLWFTGDANRVSIVTGRLECMEHGRAAIVEREINLVFHLGAQAIVGVAANDPLGSVQSNVLGTANVLEACRLYGKAIKGIVIASSDKVYGEAERLPYTEDTALRAANPYDVSKCCADLLAQSYAATYDLPIAIARCGNIYGPGDLHWSRLIPGTLRSLLCGERPVIRSDGTLIRDYLYVDDAVTAYLALAEWVVSEPAALEGQRAFNFSAREPMTVIQMVRLMQIACEREDLEPLILNEASGEIRAQELESTRAREVLGWQPISRVEQAMQTTAAWYREHLKRTGRLEARDIGSRVVRSASVSNSSESVFRERGSEFRGLVTRVSG